MRKQIKKNKLRYYRRLLDWTQTQLSEATGIGQVNISRYERGIRRASTDLKVKIASVLGLPVEVIFPEDEDRRG
ncbi:hypothetical protein ES702_07855 [subsurface metagenome]